MKSIFKIIEPYFGGILLSAIGVFLFINYDYFATPDTDLVGKSAFVTVILHYLDKVGGKYIVLIFFILLGIVEIKRDLKKNRKR